MVLCSIAYTVSEADVLNHYTHSLSTCFKQCVCRASAESSFSLVSTRPTSTQPFSTQTSGRHQVLFPKTKLAFIPLPMSLLSLRGTLFCQSRSHPLSLPLPYPPLAVSHHSCRSYTYKKITLTLLRLPHSAISVSAVSPDPSPLFLSPSLLL